MKSITRRVLCLFVLVIFPFVGRLQAAHRAAIPQDPTDSHFRLGKLLYADDFQHGLANWRVQLQKPGIVSARGGVLDIDVPAGATIWFTHELTGPVMISYDATVVSAGGPNDRVSDLNCFWMATDPASPQDIFAHPRDGAFGSYNTLRTYYVGLGGNGNTTTRFRRYIDSKTRRPLLPQNDISAADRMIVPNRSQQIHLIADGSLIEYYRDQDRIFRYIDPQPYIKGWFAIRTVRSHLQIRNLRVVRLVPNPWMCSRACSRCDEYLLGSLLQGGLAGLALAARRGRAQSAI